MFGIFRVGCGRSNSGAPSVKEGWFEPRLASPVVTIGIMDLTGTGYSVLN